jgi:hypothetical protein
MLALQELWECLIGVGRVGAAGFTIFPHRNLEIIAAPTVLGLKKEGKKSHILAISCYRIL